MRDEKFKYVARPRSGIYLLIVGVLAFGWYQYLGSDSDDHQDNGPTSPSFQRITEETEIADGRRGRSAGGQDRPGAGWLPLAGLSTEKRYGPAPERDGVHRVIDEALYSSKAEDRAWAFGELGLFEPAPEILLACSQGLLDPEPEVRLEAVLALEILEHPDGVPALEAAVRNDSSASVREAAAESLAELLF